MYVNLGINVVTWNYRGYYQTPGTPNLRNILLDSHYVYNYTTKRLNLTGPIGVHGESLGGYVATYLARNHKVDFLGN